MVVLLILIIIIVLFTSSFLSLYNTVFSSLFQKMDTCTYMCLERMGCRESVMKKESYTIITSQIKSTHL